MKKKKETSNDRIDRLNRRNDLIIKKYLELAGKKYNGKTRLYSDETILEKLSEQFFLSHRTLDDIICKRGVYKDMDNTTNQTKLF